MSSAGPGDPHHSGLDCCTGGRECSPSLYPHWHPSISLTMHPFLEMGCPCECKAISCRWPTQHLPPGLLPSPLFASVLTLLPECVPHSQGAHAHTEALCQPQPHPYQWPP